MSAPPPTFGPDAAELLAVSERRRQRAEAARIEAERLLEHHSKALARSNRELARRESELIARLERNNRHLLRAQEAAQLATFHIDRGQPPVFSPQFFAITGLPAEAPLDGRDVLAAVHPLDRARILAAGDAFVAGAGGAAPQRHEHRLTRPDGELRWLRWIIRRDHDAAGRFTAVFGTVQDITEARATERHARALRLADVRRARQLARLSDALQAANADAARAHAAHNRFLAMASHDIRTPLGGLLGLIDMLPASALPAEHRDQLARMRLAGDQLRLLVDDIINIADTAAGTLELDPAPVDLSTLLDDIAADWQRRRPAWQVRAEVRDGLATLMLDARRLRQLCNGVLLTAHSPETGAVTITATRTDGRLVLVIAGAWLDGGGANLNDLVARRIITAMGGQLITGPAGQWRCELPIVAAPASWGAEPRAAALVRRPDGGRPRLLIADDIETNRIVLGSLVARLGYDHDSVADGAAALAAVAAGDFDAVLMDVMMPVMDGAAATRAIRGLAGQAAAVPIIGITAHSLAEERAGLLAAGMTACVGKPVTAPVLARLLTEALRAAVALPVIDTAVFAAAFKPLAPARRAALLDLALADCRELAAAIAAAHAGGDDDGQRRAAHSLKGVAGNFGALQLGAALAAMAGTGDPAPVLTAATAFAAAAPTELGRGFGTPQ